jgi:hypothetical protein
MTKTNRETYSELAFRLEVQFRRWSESENAYSSLEKMRELIKLEQFQEMLDHDLKIWMLDQHPKSMVEAANLADQYVALRKNVKPPTALSRNIEKNLFHRPETKSSNSEAVSESVTREESQRYSKPFTSKIETLPFKTHALLFL